jgi:ATP-dependent exoDNAse (exonuclease V) alpha subunit
MRYAYIEPSAWVKRYYRLATQYYPMLARNLLYTGVTRGKRLVVVIGQPRALAIAVRNVRATQRLINLAARLRQADAPGGRRV